MTVSIRKFWIFAQHWHVVFLPSWLLPQVRSDQVSKVSRGSLWMTAVEHTHTAMTSDHKLTESLEQTGHQMRGPWCMISRSTRALDDATTLNEQTSLQLLLSADWTTNLCINMNTHIIYDSASCICFLVHYIIYDRLIPIREATPTCWNRLQLATAANRCTN